MKMWLKKVTLADRTDSRELSSLGLTIEQNGTEKEAMRLVRL